MAFNTVRSGVGPVTIAPGRAEARAAEAPKADYTVRDGDSLGKIARELVLASGGAPTKANIDQALAALKTANPHLTTEARKGGALIFKGDQVTYPKLGAQGGWVGSPARQGGPRPTVADAAAAQQQMRTLELQGQLATMASNSTVEIKPENRQAATDLLNRVREEAPGLVDTPPFRVINARLLPASGVPEAAPTREQLQTRVDRLRDTLENGERTMLSGTANKTQRDQIVASMAAASAELRRLMPPAEANRLIGKEVTNPPDGFNTLGRYINTRNPDLGKMAPTASLAERLVNDLKTSVENADPAQRRKVATELIAYLNTPGVKDRLGATHAASQSALRQVVERWVKDPSSV